MTAERAEGASVQNLAVADYVETELMARRLAGSSEPIEFELCKGLRTQKVRVLVANAAEWVAELRKLSAN